VVIPGFEGAPRDDVHSDAQRVLQVLEQSDVIKKGCAWLEIHEQIQIAVWVSLASSDRAPAALTAAMAWDFAPMALVALGLSGGPVHDPVHANGGRWSRVSD
jgi:hypothetical protein